MPIDPRPTDEDLWKRLDACLSRVGYSIYDPSDDPRAWRTLLRQTADAVVALMKAKADLPRLVKRLHAVGEATGFPVHGPNARAMYLTRVGQALLRTSAFQQRVGDLMGGDSHDDVRRILSDWAYDLPVVGRRLVNDSRFWKDAGARWYGVWPRVLNDPEQEAQRAWKHLEGYARQATGPTSAQGLARLRSIARWRIRAVQAMEASGVLERNAHRPWAHRWLVNAIEWGSEARVRAAVDAGVRLDSIPSDQAIDLLRHVVRSVFFHFLPTESLSTVEQYKGALWAHLLRAGLSLPDLQKRSSVSDLPPSMGNGAVWRQEVLRGQSWCPAVLHAFCILQVQGWCQAQADGLPPLAWALRHGASIDRWTPEVLLRTISTLEPAWRPRLDHLLSDLATMGVRWQHHPLAGASLIVTAVDHGATTVGLQALVHMRVNFLDQSGRGGGVVMGALATPRQSTRLKTVQALLDAAVQRHGPNGKRLLQRTDSRGASALHWAARALDAPVVAYLVEQGLSVRATDKHGRTPLHWVARRCGRFSAQHVARVVSALQRAGANLDELDHAGTSAIAALTSKAQVGMLVDLLRAHVDRLFTLGADGTSLHERLMQRVQHQAQKEHDEHDDQEVSAVAHPASSVQAVLDTLMLYHEAHRAQATGMHESEFGEQARGLRPHRRL